MTSKSNITGMAAGLACALLVSVPVSAFAADTQAAWEGYMTNTKTTAACAGVGGANVGDTHASIYRPHILKTDNPSSYLSLLFLRAALGLQNLSESSAHQMKGSGKYEGFAVNGRGKSFTYGGTFSNFTVSAFPTPAFPVVETTHDVLITGTINNLFNATGCDVSFKGIYVKRID
jgi:hypothetical protein